MGMAVNTNRYAGMEAYGMRQDGTALNARPGTGALEECALHGNEFVTNAQRIPKHAENPNHAVQSTNDTLTAKTKHDWSRPYAFMHEDPQMLLKCRVS